MGLLDLFKLEKLTIEAYKTNARSGFKIGTFVAMYNPESYSLKHEIVYSKPGGKIGIYGKDIDYLRKHPSQLSIKLVLDGTGVEDYGLVNLFGQQSVADRLAAFYQTTYQENQDIHEPNYLSIKWGKAEWGDVEKSGVRSFDCRLRSVTVNYINFDRDGSPLRAELDLVFLSDTNIADVAKGANLLSPDLTHRVVVKQGDTLPFLSQQVYGSPAHYLMLATVNGLDNFRELSPGMELSFPPLPNSAAAAANRLT